LIKKDHQLFSKGQKPDVPAQDKTVSDNRPVRTLDSHTIIKIIPYQ